MKPSFISSVIIILVCGVITACSDPSRNIPSEDRNDGISDTQILIGSSLALGGHAGYLGTQTLHGALSYLNHINEKGGVHGRHIKVIAYDDEYDPPKCVYYTQKLILEDRVFALFCYVGTPTTVKIIPLVNEAKIPLLGMFTGANELREPFSPYLINIRASYYQETRAAVQHMVEVKNIRKVAVFYQYDAYGFDGLKGTELALKEYHLVPTATATYIRGTLDIEEGLDKIIETDPEAVMMVGTYEPCAKFIKLAKSKGFTGLFYNLSFVGADELARRLEEHGDGVIVTQVVPSPEMPETRNLLWGTKEYSRRLKRYFPDDEPNFVGLEGYINAMILVEGLKRSGRNITRTEFIKAIESITDLDLGIENTVSFSSRDHQGLDRVYFTKFQEGKFVLMKEWESGQK
jgi:ABC-type branched-subunit amino acid transport system substrate-binding protein